MTPAGGRSGPAQPLELRWLVAVSWFEAVSLLVLLLNLATVHVPSVASALGPLHGLAYLTAIALAFLVPAVPTRDRLLAIVPAVGGLLAVRRIRRDARWAPDDNGGR